MVDPLPDHSDHSSGLLLGDVRSHAGNPMGLLQRMNMQPHQQRVVDEKAELDEKRSKLDFFLRTMTFKDLSQDEAGRLLRQSKCMGTYSEILGERIAAFN